MVEEKPVVLYVGDPIAFATEDWSRFQSRFTIIQHSACTRTEFVTALQPDGKYAHIQAIVRPNNCASEKDVGPFDKALIASLPPSLKLISSVNHGYEKEDTVELAKKGILYCNGAGGGNYPPNYHQPWILDF